MIKKKKKKDQFPDTTTWTYTEVQDWFKARHKDLTPRFRVYVTPDLGWPYTIQISTDPRYVVMTFPLTEAPEDIREIAQSAEVRSGLMTGICNGFLTMLERVTGEPDLTPPFSIVYIKDKTYSLAFFGSPELVEAVELIKIPRVTLSQKRLDVDGPEDSSELP